MIWGCSDDQALTARIIAVFEDRLEYESSEMDARRRPKNFFWRSLARTFLDTLKATGHDAHPFVQGELFDRKQR
jgi:hypothetical protein